MAGHWLEKGGWQTLGQGTAGGQRCSIEGGGVVVAPQGKLGAAISGQPSSPLAHLESLSSTTINPWLGTRAVSSPTEATQNYTECHRTLAKAWTVRLNCPHGDRIWDPETKDRFGFQTVLLRLEDLE